VAALEQLAPDWAGRPAGRRAVPFLLGRFAAADPGVRAEAVWALARLRPPVTGAVPRLIELRTDPNSAVRTRAAEALVAIDRTWFSSDDARRAVPTLVVRLSADDHTVRQAAAEVLAELGPLAEPATDALAGRLTDARSEVGESAAWALRRIGPSAARAAPALARSAARAAREALGEFGPAATAAVPTLVDRLVETAPWSVQEVVPVLDRIDPAWRRSAAVRESVPRWAGQIASGNPAQRGAAAMALQAVAPLGDFGPLAAEAVPPLVRDLQARPQPKPQGRGGGTPEFVRNTEQATSAAKTLGAVGPAAAEALPELLRRLAIPLHRDSLTSNEESEFSAVWEALPRIDPAWMRTPTAEEVRQVWVEWGRNRKGTRAQTQADLADRFLKRLDEARKAA
jgi:HEAT repeat protein